MGDINLQYHIYYYAHDNTDMLSYRHYSNTERESDKIQNKIERERERETADESCIRGKQIASSIVPLVPKLKYDHTPKFEMFRATMLFGCILRTMCANTSNGRERRKLTLVECTSP